MLPKRTLIFVVILALVGTVYFLFFHGDSFKGDPVEFTIFSQGSFGGHGDEKGRFVIRNADEWEGIWQKLHSNVEPLPNPPAVDFGEKMMIAVFSGQRPTDGHSVNVLSVREQGNELKVFIEETKPGRNCAVVQVITNPYVIIQTDSFEGAVEYDVRENVLDC